MFGIENNGPTISKMILGYTVLLIISISGTFVCLSRHIALSLFYSIHEPPNYHLNPNFQKRIPKNLEHFFFRTSEILDDYIQYVMSCYMFCNVIRYGDSYHILFLNIYNNVTLSILLSVLHFNSVS